MFNRFIRWPGFRSYSNELIPKDNLALLVDPGTQMIDNARANHRYPALLTGQEQVDNSDFHDFTIDYPSIGEPDPFYESDFSVDEDGWVAVNGTNVGNTDGIGGEDDVLKFYASSDNSDHYIKKNALLANIGQIYRITGKIYIPSSNTTLARVLIDNSSVSDGYIVISTTDAWVDFDFEIKNSSLNKPLIFYGQNSSGSNVWTGAGSSSDDIFYVKDIKVQRVGLVAWWQFDSYYHAQEGTGKTILQDLSGNGYDLTASGGFDYGNQLTGDDPTYKNGNALEFDGVDDYGYIPAADANAFNPKDKALTISAYINYLGSTSVELPILAKGASVKMDINVSGYLHGQLYDGSTVHAITGEISPGWHLVTFVRDVGTGNDVMRLYVDGSLVAEEDRGAKLDANNTTNNFLVGKFSSIFWNNNMAFVAHFNRALSATEVQALYGKPKHWTWNEAGTISNNNFKTELSGGAELSQDIAVDDETLYKEQKISTTDNDVDYFGNTTSHTITIGDGTWSYAGVKDVTNVDAVGSNFVEDFSKGGAVYGDELVLDSGFEQWNSSTDLTNWAEVGVSTGVRDITREASIIYSGSYSIKLKATGNDGTTDFFIEQDREACLEVGSMYKASFWSYFKQRTQGYIQLQIADESYYIQARKNYYEQESDWTYHEVYFIAIDDYARFRLYLRDETDGEVYFDDFSVVKVSNGNHGIAKGGLETNQPVFPYAWEFDGVDDYVDFGTNLNSGIGQHSFIIAAWIKRASTGSNRFLGTAQGSGTADKRIDFGFDGVDLLTLTVADGTNYVSVKGSAINDTNWHFVCAVVDKPAKVVYLYKDGELDKTQDVSTLGDDWSSDYSFVIGARNAGGLITQYFQGQIAPITIYPFDGQDGRASVMPSNYVDHYIKKIYNNTERYFK